MDKERSRRDGTAKVTFERILPGGQDIDGNVTAMCSALMCRTLHMPTFRARWSTLPGTAFLTNSLAFCLLSRVLSRGSGFNMEET